MKIQKFLISAVAGGIVAFFSGWLFYDILLGNFFSQNHGAAGDTMRAEADMVWWALILGNLFSGALLSYIFNKYANINTLGGGLSAGFVIYLIVGASYDLTCYGTSTLLNHNGMLADIAVVAVMGGITGAVVGLVNGLQLKA